CVLSASTARATTDIYTLSLHDALPICIDFRRDIVAHRAKHRREERVSADMLHDRRRVLGKVRVLELHVLPSISGGFLRSANRFGLLPRLLRNVPLCEAFERTIRVLRELSKELPVQLLAIYDRGRLLNLCEPLLKLLVSLLPLTVRPAQPLLYNSVDILL